MRRSKLSWLALWGALLFSGAALSASSDVTTSPLGVTIVPSSGTSGNKSGSITLTNTFQSVFPSAAGRRTCLIQNTGINDQYVYVGPIAGATKATSFTIGAAAQAGAGGGWFSCQSLNGLVVVDQISITGTTADTFVAIGN